DSAFQWNLEGAHLRGSGAGGGDSGSRRLQLPGEPGEFDRARYGTLGDGNRQHRDGGDEGVKFPRNARIIRGQLEVAPFAAVFFLLALFLLAGSLVYTPGVHIQLPTANDLPGTDKPSVSVALDGNGRLYFENQLIEESELRNRLARSVKSSRENLTLVVQA